MDLTLESEDTVAIGLQVREQPVIRHLAANELRQTFGVVPQETVLFAGTALRGADLTGLKDYSRWMGEPGESIARFEA